MPIRHEAVNRLLELGLWICVCVCVCVCVYPFFPSCVCLSVFSLPSSSFHLGLGTQQPQGNCIPCVLACLSEAPGVIILRDIQRLHGLL